MLNPVPALKVELNSVPKVLLQAKEEAILQASGGGKPWNKAWDKGHWANRK